jgi:internalin A
MTAPRQTRRRVSISVRMLMVLVVAVGGWLGWYVRSIRLQREAVDSVKKSHGHIGYEWEYKDDQPYMRGKPWAPAWLVKRLGVDAIGSVISVGIYDSGTDADLARIGNLKRLQHLNVLGAKMTDDGLANLEGITGLRSLYLCYMPISDAGLDHLTLKRLRWLSLQDTQITDASLARMGGLASLEYLSLNGTRITDAGLVHLKGLEGLTELSLENSAVTDAGLAHLRGLTGLKTLWLGGSKVTAECVQALRRSLPGLEIKGVP